MQLMGERRGPSGAVVFASFGMLWTLAHVLGLLGPLAEDTFAILGLGAVITTVVGVRRYRPAKVWVFAMLVAAMMLFLAGGALRQQLGTVADLSASRSLVPDLVTIPGYVLFGIGLAGIARARRGSSSFDIDAALDNAIASMAALAVAWAYLITPALEQTHAPLQTRLMLAAYPPLSIYLVALTLQIAFVTGARPSHAQRLLVVAMSSMFVGDIVYMLYDAHIADLPERVLDVPYALAYVAFSTCMLHPSMRELLEPVPRAERTTRQTRLAVVSASLTVPILLGLVGTTGNGSDRTVLLAVVGVLVAAAVWRVFRALRAHARSEEVLVHQATHDPLTGLPNRAFLNGHVEAALTRHRGLDRYVALLFLDVDRFKVVNDSMGHGHGDELLVAIAKRLKGIVPHDSTVARVGGDEFVVVLDGFLRPDEARGVAENIRACFQIPMTVRRSEIHASVSIGVAVAAPSSTSTVEALLRDADTAMYQAKDAGRDAVVVFDSEMRDRAARRLELEHDLRDAVKTGALTLSFQPIVQLPSRTPVGLEALLRWVHPRLGHIPPAVFVPIAEETGLIVEIGAWVVDQACANLARWRRELPGHGRLFVAVNLSVRQLRDATLVDHIRDALARHGLEGSALSVEVTESILLKQSEANLDALRQLRTLGIRIAIDDFGTGYSSLAYLRTFPVDEVKIDKSFVDDLDNRDSTQESLVAAIVAMAKALGLKTVAEGVETTVQHDRLIALGVDTAQGYVYARPVDVDSLPTTLTRLRQHERLRSVDRPMSEAV